MSESGKTKQAIFETALTLFSQDGYHRVSMKQIADAVGIAPPSIYNHFTSKEAILTSIYKYFDEKNEAVKPDLEELLALCDKMHPRDVMRKTVYTYPEIMKPLIYKSMVVSASMMRADIRADDIIHRNLIKMPYEYDIPILTRLQELGRIEPIDADTFTLLHSCYCFSSAVRFYSNRGIGTCEWCQGLEMLFQLIIPTALVTEEETLSLVTG